MHTKHASGNWRREQQGRLDVWFALSALTGCCRVGSKSSRDAASSRAALLVTLSDTAATIGCMRHGLDRISAPTLMEHSRSTPSI